MKASKNSEAALPVFYDPAGARGGLIGWGKLERKATAEAQT